MGAKTRNIVMTAVILAGAAMIFWQQREIHQLKIGRDAAPPTSSHPARGSSRVANTRASGTPDQLAATFVALLRNGGADNYSAWRDRVYFLESLQPGQFRAFLEAYKKTAPENAYAPNLVVAAWAEKDPEAALGWVKENNNFPALALYQALFDTWANKDMAAALTAAEQLPSTDEAQRIYAYLLARMARAGDPRGALERLLKLPVAQQNTDMYSNLFYAWAATDPQGAAMGAMALPPSQTRDDTLRWTGALWARQDPQAALAWADGLPGQVKSAVIPIALQTLASRDLDAARTFFEGLPPGPLHDASIAGIAKGMAGKDPGAALAWIDEVSVGQVHDRAVGSLFSEIGGNNPARAAVLLANITDSSIRDNVIPQLADFFTRGDMQVAVAWAQSLPTSDGDARLRALTIVMEQMTQSNPAAAAAYVASIPDDPNYKRLANQVGGRWAAVDSKAALAWAESLPNGTGKDNAVGAAVSTIARSDPQAAWNYALTMPPGSGTVQTQANILSTWSTQDPAAAAALLDALPADTVRDDRPSGTIRDAATMNVVNNWLKQDPLAASKWINEMPASGTKDDAITALISVEGKNDLGTAFSWASSISGNDARSRQMENVVTQWAKKDPAAAVNAVQQTPMGDGQRAALLDYIRKESLK